MLNQADFSDITLTVDGNPIYCHQVSKNNRLKYYRLYWRVDQVISRRCPSMTSKKTSKGLSISQQGMEYPTMHSC